MNSYSQDSWTSLLTLMAAASKRTPGQYKYSKAVDDPALKKSNKRSGGRTGWFNRSERDISLTCRGRESGLPLATNTRSWFKQYRGIRNGSAVLVSSSAASTLLKGRSDSLGLIRRFSILRT
nr:hypothetical protein CFP56_64595 [Quercus suber]